MKPAPGGPAQASWPMVFAIATGRHADKARHDSRVARFRTRRAAVARPSDGAPTTLNYVCNIRLQLSDLH